MANFYLDNDDLQFYINQFIPWDEIVKLVERDPSAEDAPKNGEEALEFYRDVLGLVGEFVAEEVAPVGRIIDAEGMHLDADGEVRGGEAQEALLQKLKELGLFGLTLPREWGGSNAPVLLYFIINEMFARADVSTMTHFAFYAGTANAMLYFSLKEGSLEVGENGEILGSPWKEQIEDVIEGNSWGSMDLTEPDAGSDLAALRGKAEKDENGVWRITANKIFITSGHGQHHLVLAKTDDRDDLDAISLFWVPTRIERDGETIRNAYVDRVEEKIGHHGSATCSVQFENSEGRLIGKEGEGFKMMLLLMNNARIGVGFESIGSCEAAYRLAKAYAEERKSMGKTIDRHEMIADYLDEMDVTIRGLRAMAVEAAIHEETANQVDFRRAMPNFDQSPDKEALLKKQKRSKRRARQITPLLKYMAAEAAVDMCRMGMQIHGGYGYMQEYDAERLLRDALVLPVYEGTSQIQALMAFKDTMLGAIRNPQKFVRRLAAAKFNAVRERDPLKRRVYALKSLSLSAQQHILLRIAKDKWSSTPESSIPEFIDAFLKDWDPKRDFSFGLLHAENLTQILGDVAIAEILMRQSVKFPERRELVEAWLDRAEPRARFNLEKIYGNSERVLRKLAAKKEKQPAPKAPQAQDPKGDPISATVH